jgi:hypothetical protein
MNNMDLSVLLIVVAILVCCFLVNQRASFETFSDFVKHKVYITEPPPHLPEKDVHWDDNYTHHANNVHHITHAPILTNNFPMGKPPSLYEKKSNGESVDIARAQFITRMEKRK